MSIVKRSAIRNAYAKILFGLESAKKSGSLPKEFDAANAALTSVVSAFSGDTVADADGSSVNVDADSIQQFLLSPSELLEKAAQNAIDADAVEEINALLHTLQRKIAEQRALILEAVGEDKIESVRLPEIPEKFLVSVGKRGRSGKREERDWSADTYTAKGWTLTVFDRDEDGTPCKIKLTDKENVNRGVFTHDGRKRCWTAAFDVIQKEENYIGQTNVPEWFNVPKA